MTDTATCVPERDKWISIEESLNQSANVPAFPDFNAFKKREKKRKSIEKKCDKLRWMKQ
jgi:hypothetical protein